MSITQSLLTCSFSRCRGQAAVKHNQISIRPVQVRAYVRESETRRQSGEVAAKISSIDRWPRLSTMRAGQAEQIAVSISSDKFELAEFLEDGLMQRPREEGVLVRLLGIRGSVPVSMDE